MNSKNKINSSEFLNNGVQQAEDELNPWIGEPTGFFDFCSSSEHMDFPPLSEKQKEWCRAAFPDDPKKTFERIGRAYDVLVALVGKGGGKDQLAALITCYFVYLLLNLRDPFSFVYGAIVKGEPIDVLIVAPRGRTAEKVTYEKVKQKILNWKWLKTKYMIRESGRAISAKDVLTSSAEVEIGSNTITFPKSIRLFSLNSSQESAEGFNPLVFICTEFAAFVNSDDRPNADKIYRTLYSSAKTRFPGKFIGMLISYPRYKGDAIMKMYEESQKPGSNIFGIKASTWEFNPMCKREDFIKELESDDPKVQEDARAKYLCEPGEKESRYIEHLDRVRACISSRQPVANLESYEEVVNGMKMLKLRITGFNTPRRPDSIKHVVRVDLGKVHDRAALTLAHLEGGRIIIDLIAHWIPDPKRKLVVDVDDPANMILDLKKRFANIIFCSYDSWNCLTGDTRISLLDGTEIPICELEGKENFGVYSYDDKTGCVVPGKGHSARKTGEQVDIFSVKLDDGKEIRATAEHLFMLRDGTYRMLKDLSPGDSLMPLYRKYDSKALPGYEKTYNPGKDSWSYTHRIVVKNFGIKLSKGKIVHHVNFKKLDNRPENLKVMTQKEHAILHSITLNRWHKDKEKQKRATEKMRNARWTEEKRKTFGMLLRNNWKDEKKRQKMLGGMMTAWKDEKKATKWRKSLKEANSSESHRKNVSEAVKKVWAESPERKEKQQKITSEQFKLLWKDPAFREKMKKRKLGQGMLGKHHSELTRQKISKSKLNHKVVSICYTGKEDVYDITVEKFHNFAVSSGVFVHNSLSSINRLNRARIVTDILSLRAEEYKLFLHTLYTNSVDLLNFPALTDEKTGELFHLTLDASTGKVDHEDGWHNDITETVCGVVAMLKGTKKNMENIDLGLSNVPQNIHMVSNSIWSDEEEAENEETDNVFPGESVKFNF